jgi:hypothetical protein
MRIKLLRALAYSLDGINSVQHNAGDEAEIKDEHINSLQNAGYIANAEEAPAEETPSAPKDHPAVDDHPFAHVEIIEAWEHLDWGAYRSLGSSLSGSPVANKAEATAAIEAELNRREAWAKDHSAGAD